MNENVLAKAKELAAVIAVSPEFVAMRMAEDAASQDEGLVALYGEYAEKQEKIEEISSSEAPDYAELGKISNELSALKDEIQKSVLAKGMQDARRVFSDMMRGVNEELQKVLSPESDSCGGNCSSCGGHCHH